MPSADTQSATVSHVDPEDITKLESFISSLKSVTEFNHETEQAVQEFTLIIDFYQEQPHVLDPHLQGWIDSLLAIGISDEYSQLSINLAFKYLYMLTKVRGQKYVVRLLPHEVADIERVLSLLESDKSEIWHAKYILLLWLSILVLIPFDLKRLDGDEAAGFSVRRMLNIATSKLEGSDKSSEAASLVVAKLVTRPDLHAEHLRSSLTTLLSTCMGAEDDAVFGSRRKLGCLTSISRIYKLGRREYLLPHSSYVLQELINLHLGTNTNTLLRKFETKLAQRLGLSFLAPRVAKWRYTRGNRLLADSLKGATRIESVEKAEKEDEDEEYDIPDEIEDVLEILFRGLKDPETIVRWSAAKGVGRITARLPRFLTTDIVTQLLDCFSPLETSSSWHGGCLALAELGRHGFLLPEYLPEVVPILIRALQYDEKRGNLAIGANVRDAACYLSWSFARTYDPSQIKPFVHSIASALILTTLFDRHIGCRRAASAAFQENVGRQGSFPFGIDILTTCDYYAVALQSNTYHKLSVAVASYPPYTRPIIDYLKNNRARHWCPSIRTDTGIALGLLCSVDAEYISSDVLEFLLSSIDTGDFNCRHGALHSIGNICSALSSSLNLISPICVDKINSVLQVLEERGSFRGSGSDEIRGAVCFYIQKVSGSGVELVDSTLSSWQTFLNSCLVNPEQNIGVQDLAVEALAALSHQHYTADNSKQWESIVPHYTSQLRHEFIATRIGSALALSVLPGCVLRPHLSQLPDILAEHTRVTSKAETSLAECRVSAVKAIANIQLVCLPDAQTRTKIYKVLLACLEDYSTDSRGDIGSYVREAAMTSLLQINKHILALGHPTIHLTFTKELRLEIVCGFLQQSVEKIDRTRHIALSALAQFIHSEVELPQQDLLREAVPLPPDMAGKDEALAMVMERTKVGGSRVLANDPVSAYIASAEYFSPAVVFSRVMCLVQAEEYVCSLIRGLVVSIGGLTESLVKASSSAFVDFLEENEDQHRKLCDSLIKVMRKDAKNDRVIVPMLKTVELALTNIMLEEELGNYFISEFVKLLKIELTKCGNVPKLLAAVSPLSNCLQFSGNKCALTQISLLLCHRYPRVRKGMADAFYTALVTYDDALANSQEVSQILETTVWEDPNNIAGLREKRNRICELVGVKPPKLLAPTNKPAPTPVNTEAFDSYSDLVGRAGY